MNTRIARVYAVVFGLLTLAGLFGEGHFYNLINVDVWSDFLRLVMTMILGYVGFFINDEMISSAALVVVGATLVATGLVGLVVPELGGILPSGLTFFDIAFNLTTGVAVIAVGLTTSGEVVEGEFEDIVKD
ncbi:MAG: hypothetical protein ACM3KH_00580 [Thiobacillus sp.]